MKEQEIDLERLDAILKYLPLLERSGCGSSQSWKYFHELHSTFYKHGWILTDFDWPRWNRESEELYRNPQKLSAADLPTVRKLITYHCRADRFCEGHLEEMFQTGHILSILRRLQDIMKTMTGKLPFDRSYWVLPGKLMAGCYPGGKKLDQEENNLKGLVACGIRTVINLMEEDEKDHSGKPFRSYEKPLKKIAADMGEEISCIRIAVKDLSIPSLETMQTILDRIDQSIAQGRPVYVHCWGGRGRTGTIVGCYLVRQGLTGENALEQIKKLRKLEPTAHKPSPETDDQRNMVRNWREKPKKTHVVVELKPGDKVMLISGMHKGKSGAIQEFDEEKKTLKVILDEDKNLHETPGNLKNLVNQISRLDRYRGCLIGVAVGDAVGTAVEFRKPGTFTPIKDMIGGGPFKLKAGQWTDDTSMALCLAASLTETKTFDPSDQMKRFVRWHKEGYLSSNGKCFDIGITTASALRNFEKTGNPFSGSEDIRSAGNGSIMRLAPVPMFFGKDAGQAIEKSGESSRTTHGAKTCIDACRYLAGLIVGLLDGEPKDKVLSDLYCPIEGCWEENPLHSEIEEVARGSFKHKQPPEIVGKGYVVKTLEAALWAFYRSSTFEDGCLKVVNLGDDADTTAAVYGQIAGAYYGINGIPPRWRQRIAFRELIESMADQLHDLSNGKR